ncbi:CLUMA_CG000094, isoform A [Clunio marinus]|uniref:CLUMA_CG000094, isoform A n=1 Tax=Clunio marinus TaxID=568069 RepID=A0A1J1HEF6_9DIPT|nr:CLUMA_CG000094, isoform A [Clunio marinus]
MEKLPLQTLQIYKKIERVPADMQIKKIAIELENIRKKFPMPLKEKSSNDGDRGANEIYFDPPRVRNINLQNLMIRLESELTFWVADYRQLMDEIRELDRILPKTEHELQESDDKAQENVEKIIKIENIKDDLLEEFKKICISFEENETTSRRKIKKLETELAISQARIDCLEYELAKEKKLNKKIMNV